MESFFVEPVSAPTRFATLTIGIGAVAAPLAKGFILRHLWAIAAAVVLTVSCAAAASSESDDANLEIVGKYLDATKMQQSAMRGVNMEADIDAKLPKLEKQGKLLALRSISKLGQITYKALGFSGDTTVKQEVILRYLAAESEARDNGSIAINPANYKFRLKATLKSDKQNFYVFQLTPRTKRIGLFKGELWLDGKTGMPVRESGELVKNPSVFLKKVEFTREYEMHDGVAFPSHLESTVDTRLVGRAELSIVFSHFTRDDDETEADQSHFLDESH
jgi:hypothetical protein